MLWGYNVSVGLNLKMITIFDLSFAAIPDLNKQAEDIDFFFEEYIRSVTFILNKEEDLGRTYFQELWRWSKEHSAIKLHDTLSLRFGQSSDKPSEAQNNNQVKT